jgi:hypothetical protein
MTKAYRKEIYRARHMSGQEMKSKAYRRRDREQGIQKKR